MADIDPPEPPKETVVPVPPPTDGDQVTMEAYNLVKDFFLSGLDEQPLSSKLSIKLRTAVHLIAEEFKMYHKSYGKKNDRHIVLKRAIPCLQVGKFNPLTKQWDILDTSREDFPPATTAPEVLRVATYNVLFEAIDPKKPYNFNDLIHTATRRPHTLKTLQALNADIITLNEVTPDFFADLLKEEWVRESYYVGDVDGKAVNPGNMIISKYPISSVLIHTFNNSPKTVIVGKVRIGERDFSVAAVHLKAGNKTLFAHIRVYQQREVVYMQTRSNPDDACMMGDFNIRDNEGEEHKDIMQFGYADVWKRLKPDDPGYTYDIITNPLAKAISARIHEKEGKIGGCNRFDRMLLKSEFWRPTEIARFGTEAVTTIPGTQDPLFPSDHYGLVATFSRTA